MAVPAKTREDFWRDYAEQCGEEVLAYSMGRYLSGWHLFTEPCWGLLIATSGGFRFHHFPHESWLMALTRTTTGGEAPKEKTIFIPREQILSVEFRREKSLLKRLFLAPFPRVVIRYRRESGEEADLWIESDQKAGTVVRELLPGSSP